MPYLNLNRPEEFPSLGLILYRGAMSRELCEDISVEASSLVANHIEAVMQEQTGTGLRRFRASRIERLGVLPLLITIADQAYLNLLETVKVNAQGMCGRQAWHTDYIPEPVILYPEGSDYLDLSPGATSIREARATVLDGGLVSIPIEAGDVALLERGSEIYHRGRNASDDQHRLTTVLH